MKSTDVLYLILYTSQTGKPRGTLLMSQLMILGIVRESGGNAVQLVFTIEFIFNIKLMKRFSAPATLVGYSTR